MTGVPRISLWDRSSPEAPPREAESLPEHVDLAIVGGGFTGLSTALHAAEAGLSAHVLEARQVGYGGSGRNVGLVNAGIWLPPHEVKKTLGPSYGPRFLKRFGDGPETVFDLIEKFQIRCEATRSGTIHAAHAPSGLPGLRARAEEWQSMGAPVELLDRDAVSEKVGSRAFHGGLLDRRAGTINPMGYARGLARAALAAGASITTGTTVTRLVPENGGWRVETSKGSIGAKYVVLGTNAYTDQLWPGLSRSYMKMRYFQLATVPLGERSRGILPEGQGLWDTGLIMRSIRRDAHGRILIGSMGSLIGTAQSGVSRRWAQRQLSRVFPDLGPVEFEEAWDGQFAMTPDHLPRIHILAEGLYTPIGYNGRGITTGTIFGQAMAGLLTGMDPADLPLPVTNVIRAEAKLRSRVYALGFMGNQILRGF
ncbi:FAD-dependent oxidoreductase [Rhodobacterales bacterium HKCCE3408]|nr:FAD-dependent oxidoreductase [Rhodobacterales bacterium HKCCE3408]